jgi:hypothetical protein
MSLSLRGVLGDGLDRLRSVNGTLFIGIIFLLTAATEAVLGGLRLRLTLPGPTEELLTVSPVSLSVSGPAWVLSVGLVLLFALTLASTIVLVRLVLADEMEAVPLTVYDALVPAVARLAVAGLVVLVLTMIGSIFFLLPGLFILVSLLFYAVFIARGEGVLSSMRKSWGLARGSRLKLFALFLVLFVLNMGLEAVAYVAPSAMLGLLLGATGTVYALIVTVEAYRQLGGETG